MSESMDSRVRSKRGVHQILASRRDGGQWPEPLTRGVASQGEGLCEGSRSREGKLRGAEDLLPA